MLTPNAFSTRSAISGESAVPPFRSSESVVFRTPRISAARVTLSPQLLDDFRADEVAWTSRRPC